MSSALNLVRGVAAFLVMIGHLRALVFVPFDEVTSPDAFTSIVYFLCGFGHQAVIIFFVLSGFFISLSILRAMAEGYWSWPRYLLQRGTRLYIVLVPALLLGALWDRLGFRLVGLRGFYAGLAGDHIIGYSVAERAGLLNLLGNLLFLQEIITVPFGSNGVLWSLSYEFWYYMLFPSVLLVFVGRTVGSRFRYAGLSFLIALVIGETLRAYFLIWLLGAAVALVPPPRNWTVLPRRILLSGSVLILAMSLVSIRIGMVRYGDHVLAVCFAVALYAVTHGLADRNGARWWDRFAKHWAGFSYTLYLVHLPLLVLAASLLTDAGLARWQPTPPLLAAGVGLALTVTVYAWAISRFTEARTDFVRQWLDRSLRDLAGFTAGRGSVVPVPVRVAGVPASSRPTREVRVSTVEDAE